ncbi:MAG: FAD binding domain-containing protein [Actinobacteria bacterium]|nr:FAD binding domain-containing protein [Actinomycetota bacterium]
MKLSPFDYLVPDSVDAAIEMLAQYGEDGRLLAGGQSLLPMMAFRLAAPATLIDLNRLTELTHISAESDAIRVGAMVRERAAERSGALLTGVPLLARALPLIGHEAIRTRGTIGGSLSHCDPASELPAVAVAVAATMTARSQARGERVIAAEDFFVTHYTNALEADELLTHVAFPLTDPGTGVAFEEMARRHGDFGMVGVAILLHIAVGTIDHARVVLTGVADGPFRSEAAEHVLIGADPGSDCFAAAANAAREAIDPPSDLHASAAYRREVAGILVRRGLEHALADALGHE